MSLLQLKNANATQFPSGGGWGFIDPKTGFKCVGYEGTPQMHAAKIISHRRANPKFYPPGEAHWFDPNSVIQEIYQQKFKTHPHLFKGYGNAPVANTQRAAVVQISPTVLCSCGSNDFTPIRCLTCGGHRITGYKCAKCGKELKK